MDSYPSIPACYLTWDLGGVGFQTKKRHDSKSVSPLVSEGSVIGSPAGEDSGCLFLTFDRPVCAGSMVLVCLVRY